MREQLRALESCTTSPPSDPLSLLPPAPSPSAARATQAQLDTVREAAALLESLGGSPADSGASVPPTTESEAAPLDVSGLDFALPPEGCGDISGKKEQEETISDDLLTELASLPDLDVLEDTLWGSAITTEGQEQQQQEQQQTLEEALKQLDDLSMRRGLVRDFGAAEERNEAGLRRGRKEPALGAGGKRTYAMEDAHATACPLAGAGDAAAFVVCDGFAGRACAADAAAELPRALASALAQVPGGAGALRDLAPLWPRVFAAADAALRAHEYVGCTATVLAVWRHADGTRYAQAANVGDSAACLCRARRAAPLTADHKATSAAERARLAAAGHALAPAQTRINGIAVARALGVHFVKGLGLGIIAEPFISEPIALPDADDEGNGEGDDNNDIFAIVASDGLWDVTTPQAACDIARTQDSAAAMARALVRHAVAQRACVDNVTVLAVRL